MLAEDFIRRYLDGWCMCIRMRIHWTRFSRCTITTEAKDRLRRRPLQKSKRPVYLEVSRSTMTSDSSWPRAIRSFLPSGDQPPPRKVSERNCVIWRPGFPSNGCTRLGEDYGFVAVEEDAVFDVPADGAR